MLEERPQLNSPNDFWDQKLDNLYRLLLPARATILTAPIPLLVKDLDILHHTIATITFLRTGCCRERKREENDLEE